MNTWANLCARFLTAGGLRKHHMAHIAFGLGLFTGGFGLHFGINTVGACIVPASAGNTRRQVMLIKDLEADALICDATFHSDEWHERLPHLTAAQAAELGKQAAVKRLILTHFQPGADAQSLTREAQAVYSASEPAKPGIWLHL